MIISVVGTASSGKSTTSRAIAKALPSLHFLQFGVDAISLHIVPHRYVEALPKSNALQADFSPSEDANKGFYLLPSGPNKYNSTPYLFQQIGIVGRQAMSGMLNAVRHLSLAGLNILVDTCFIFPDIMQEAKEKWADLSVVWVYLNHDLDVIEQREKIRADMIIGIARGLQQQMCLDFVPDLMINQGNQKPDEIAATLIAKLDQFTI
ncbi:MAG: phosphotransferase-like protein [Legionella sp.]